MYLWFDICDGVHGLPQVKDWALVALECGVHRLQCTAAVHMMKVHSCSTLT
jgi:hypothetical protein